jgi:DHA3 family macrolide efflux protein-like MFS transporter
MFLAAQAVSLFGSAVVQYAISWHINLSTGGSTTYMAWAVLCGFVPTFLLSPFAGVWADRYNRRVMVVISDACIAAATIILALVVRSGGGSLTPLFIALIIRAFGTAIQMPCVTAIIPATVPEEQLTRINGLFGSIQAVMTILSPMLAMLLYQTVPFYLIFFIDVVTAVIGISITLFAFKYQHKPSALEKNDYLGELVQGLRYIKTRRYLLLFFIGMAVINFLCAPIAFMSPSQLIRNDPGQDQYLVWLEIVVSVGMIVGGVVIAGWGGFKNRVHTMIAAGIIVSAATMALGIRMQIVPYLIICFVCGLAMPGFNTPGTVMLQEKIEDEFRGRVFSVMTMISTAAMPLGMLVFGPIGDAIAIEYLMLISGALMLGLGGAILTQKPLLAAGLPERIEPYADSPPSEE